MVGCLKVVDLDDVDDQRDIIAFRSSLRGGLHAIVVRARRDDASE